MSVFKPTNDPPSLWGRVRGHPEVWVAAWSVIVAAQVMIDLWVAGFKPSPSLGELPLATAALLSLALAGGGLCALTGVLNRWDNRSRAWAVERAGWLVMAVGWACYAWVVFRVFPGSTITWGSAIMLTIMAVTRLLALKAMEHQARQKRAKLRAALGAPEQ